MWKFILAIIVLLSLSVSLGWMIQQDPGYVLLSYHHWSLETSLWFALASILLLSLIINWTYKLLKHSIILPIHIADWSSKRKQKLAALETAYGLCELLETHWDKAEQKLTKSARYVPNTFVNYLAAAFAAQYKKDFNARDEYLQKAQLSLHGSELAIELFKTRLQLEAGQSILALHSLQKLLGQYPKHPAILQLAQKLYLELNEWPALLNLLPAMNKYVGMTAEEAKQLSLHVYTGLLKQAVAKQDKALLEQAWLAVPTIWKTQAELLAIYAEFYIQDMPDSVLKLLEDKLKKSWDENLVRLYGLAITKSPAKQLKLAESWLKQHPRNASLFTCLARLSARDQLWGKAQDYFNMSLSIEPKAGIYWELAKIQEQLKRVDAAQESYKKGLSLAATQEMN